MELISRPRIASVAPSVTRILWELGATERFVGVTRRCNEIVPVQGIQDLRIPGDCWNLDAEGVVQLYPDLMIGSVPHRPEVLENILAPEKLSETMQGGVCCGVAEIHNKKLGCHSLVTKALTTRFPGGIHATLR